MNETNPKDAQRANEIVDLGNHGKLSALIVRDVLAAVRDEGRIEQREQPTPVILHCPECRARHIDVGEFATKVHHTHSCQSCGLTWRPAVVPTVGVQFLPGFKNPSPIASVGDLVTVYAPSKGER